MADNYKEEIKTALQKDDLTEAAKKSLEYLNRLSSIPLKIAITGASGSGKSTLVNALRGIRNGTEGAAPTGAVETTTKPTEYIHPQNDKIRIWDLPGIGTLNFRADKYLEQVEFEKYDFFIIVSERRFRENDGKLAHEIQKMKKNFYFVRSQIDLDVLNEKRDKPGLTEEGVLKIVRKKCTENLQELGFESPKFFLVSGVELGRYEFGKLWDTLKKELPEHQKNALLHALPIISLDVINEKRKALQEKIVWYTLGSAAGAAVPVPGLSQGVDLSMIVGFTIECRGSLGISPESLQRLSKVSGVSLHELKKELKSPLASAEEITVDIVLKVLSISASFIASSVIETGLKFVPFVGTVVAMGLSSITTNRTLHYVLDTLAADAQQVFMKAVGLKKS